MDIAFGQSLPPPDRDTGWNSLRGHATIERDLHTQKFNRSHARTGHVLQGRFKSIVVDKDSYLLELCCYIVLNPVRAGMAQHPKDYPWPSYRATAEVSDESR